MAAPDASTVPLYGEVPSSPFYSGTGTSAWPFSPSAVAFSPVPRPGVLLAVADGYNDTVAMFSIALDGSATQVASATAAKGPFSMAFSHDGQLLAVGSAGDFDSASLSVFSVRPGGAIVPVARSPFSIAAGVAGWIAFSADGRLLAVPTRGPGGLSMFSVTPPDGSVTPLAGSPLTFSFADDLTSAAFSPDGSLLAISGSSSNSDASVGSVTLLPVEPGGGLGSPVAHAATGTYNAGPVAFSSDGKLLAVRAFGTQASTVCMYAIGAGGSLVPVSGSPFTVTGLFSLALGDKQPLLATANWSDKTMSVFDLPRSGAPTPVSGSPFSASAVSVSFSPRSHFLAAADARANHVHVYARTPEYTEMGSPYSVGAEPFVAMSLSGRVAVAAGFKTTIFRGNQDGSLTKLGAVTTPGSAISVAFLNFQGPADLFAVGDGGSIWVYRIADDGTTSQTCEVTLSQGFGLSMWLAARQGALAATHGEKLWLYTLQAGGTLSATSSSPYQVDSLSGPPAFGLIEGTFLAVPARDGIWMFTVANDLSLNAVNGSPFPSEPHGSPTSVQFEPGGAPRQVLLWATQQAETTASASVLSRYTVATDGTLEYFDSCPTGDIPRSLAVAWRAAAVVNGGRSSGDDRMISTYGERSGALAELPGSPLIAGRAPQSVAMIPMSPPGVWLAVGDAEGTLSMYRGQTGTP